MIAIIYEKENDKHPFHFLNQVPGSVDIIKILEPLEKHELLQGTRISLMHEHEKNILLLMQRFNAQKYSKFLKQKLVTPPYQPRTNEVTERANQTIMKCLRKHAEENINNWDEWLDYITIVYNTRVHTSTGFSHYELMLARPELNTSYPLNKLKVLPDNDRTRRGIKEYFLKWADYPESEKSWVRESDFVSMECVDQNLKSEINQNEKNTVKGARGLTDLKMIFTFITYLLALGPAFCEQFVKDNFKCCTFNDNSPKDESKNFLK
ncbi:hypothetical protein BpHYR1_042574 [Brachionus plicatilis]|uniref:Uncharacterized protein n=1 Tax=Brachionus plicatilis TaxID=10195 RepID=A0A3M7SAV1_BRAPC|nr:hypothetical protein BpHYR1_042574 [Brachionus plicatilis]